MSFFVFAGSAQFVTLQLLGVGSGLFPILSAVFILNLRHFFMGMTLGDRLPKVKVPLMAYLGHSITDETFGVNIVKASENRRIIPRDMLGTNVIAHLSWVLASFLGALVGNKIPIDTKIATAALPIMFAVLLGLQLKCREDIVVMISSAVVTVFFMHVIGGSWPFIVAAILIPTIATIFDVKKFGGVNMSFKG